MSDDQFTQLSQAIQAMDKKFDDKFDVVDDKFEAMDKKFAGQLTKLFKYMDKEFKTVRNEIAETKGLVNSCVTAVDAFAKQTEIYHHEVLALGHKVDRHEKWHQQTAKAIGIKLSGLIF